jgi:hypothetical protein
MTYEVQPLPFKPHRLDGLSDRLLVSHYENNYGGAVRRLNAIEGRLADLEWLGRASPRRRHHGLACHGRLDRAHSRASQRGIIMTKWVTRERPKIDRIACPWLIRRFVEKEAVFIYVPADRVFAVAKQTGAIPYDIPGAEPFAHDGEFCSFDALIKHFGLNDPALARLAVIVRGADTARHDLAAEASGLHAISMGLSANIQDDHVMLEHGMVIYDALYTWCCDLHGEVHNWTPGKAKAAPAPEGVP